MHQTSPVQPSNRLEESEEKESQGRATEDRGREENEDGQQSEVDFSRTD